VGNYFIYTPSYEYLNNLMLHLNFDEEVDIFVQEKDMNDNEKSDFLNHFQNEPSKTTLGFLVIGGAFSEGIDLVSDRLIGAMIIGVGMPKINFRSDQISEYYKNNGHPGYEYAYLNPGLNKVMQALGRVIRDEDDRGVVLLLDERYTHKLYQNLFNLEQKDYEIAFAPTEVEEIVINFFKK
jgi:Rad3-related DNA helicase